MRRWGINPWGVAFLGMIVLGLLVSWELGVVGVLLTTVALLGATLKAAQDQTIERLKPVHDCEKMGCKLQ